MRHGPSRYGAPAASGAPVLPFAVALRGTVRSRRPALQLSHCEPTSAWPPPVQPSPPRPRDHRQAGRAPSPRRPTAGGCLRPRRSIEQPLRRHPRVRAAAQATPARTRSLTSRSMAEAGAGDGPPRPVPPGDAPAAARRPLRGPDDRGAHGRRPARRRRASRCAVDRKGGTVAHVTEHVRVRALPDHLPQSIGYSLEPLDDLRPRHPRARPGRSRGRDPAHDPDDSSPGSCRRASRRSRSRSPPRPSRRGSCRGRRAAPPRARAPDPRAVRGRPPR